ncbi:MAG: molybdopterin-dependent oxidoreductase [Actinomycetota bacterium]|nr:molybdopterin-dependent oxidoreductase [Actinomycetota bacterium]
MISLIAREDSFSSRGRAPAVTSRVGVGLGIAITVCFLTGLLSHAAQDLVWFPWPTRPSWGYRVTQGAHVISGVAAIPLLLVKLWSVYPRLFVLPRVKSLIHALERLSIALLVSSVIFELTIGVLNIAKLYLWPFDFRDAHFAVAWIAFGSLLLHIAVKLPIIRTALSRPLESGNDDVPPEAGPDLEEASAGVAEEHRFPRRTVLASAYIASGLAALSVAGGSIPWLQKLAVLSPSTGTGPQGVPINRTAAAAGISDEAIGPDFALQVVSERITETWSLDELRTMPQHTVTLPITCVEGWSTNAEWTGVRISDLLEAVDAPAKSRLRIISLQTRAAYGESVLPAQHSADPLTLLALRLNGEELARDHGFPCRLIAPSRPGVLQTKWVHRIEVLG